MTGLAVAEDGRVLVTGYTTGAFPGYERVGEYDAFLLRVTPQ